jgi:hypothetical protein
VRTTMTRVRTSWQQSRRRPAWGSLCVAVLVLLAPAGASAATPISFLPAETYPVHSSPYAVAVGELTGDGRSDVVTANSQTGDVSVLLSEPDGKLAPAINYSVGNSVPIAVTIGDVIGDGHNDIVVATTDPNEIVVLSGDGNGKFGAPISSPTPTGGPVSFLALGDFNKDGKLDLVTANGFAGTISIAPGVGDGTFDAAAAKTYSAAAEPNSNLATVRVADFNHDGKLDVASATSGCGYLNSGRGEVEIHLGNGHGELETEPVADVRDSCVASMNVADLNKDGIPDIVTANEEPQSGGGYLSTILSKGNGSVGSLILSPPIAFPASPAALTLPDLNGDGTPDAAVATTGGQIAVLTGNGDGTFGSPQTFSANATYVDGITYGDFNGDGKPDIVTADQPGGVSSGGSVSVFLNSTGTTPPQPPAQQQPPAPPPPSPLVQICSLIGPNTPNNPTAALLKHIDGKTLLIKEAKGGHTPVSFALYITAGLEETQVCEANIELLNATPFGVPTPTTLHYTFVTAPSALTPEHTFWYDPVRGWLDNPGAPQDWGLTAPNAQFSVDWSGAGLNNPKKPVDIHLEDTAVVFDQSPLTQFRGPLVETGLIQGSANGEPLSLIARIKPEAFIGARLSLSVVKSSCYENAFAYGPRLFNALSRYFNAYEELEAEATTDLTGAIGKLLPHIPGLLASSKQLAEAVAPVVSSLGDACRDGVRAYNSKLIPGLLVVAAAVAFPEGDAAYIASQVGKLIFVPAAAAAAAGVTTATETATGPLPGTVKLLRTRQAKLRAGRLHRAPLPGRLITAVDAIRPFHVPVKVGSLLVDGTLGPGRWVVVAGGKLPSKPPHHALLVLSGPGYYGTRAVRVRDGVAAADLQLPRDMAPGAWTLALVDGAGLSVAGQHRSGDLSMRLTSFDLPGRGKARRRAR